jgi:uncharacterized protein YbaR (Trm112 family)
VNLAPIGYVRCPACSGEVAPAPCALCCIQCRRSFPVDNGIPVLLDQDTAVMWANIAALDAEMAWYPLVLTTITLLARVWLPAGGRDRGDRFLRKVMRVRLQNMAVVATGVFMVLFCCCEAMVDSTEYLAELELLDCDEFFAEQVAGPRVKATNRGYLTPGPQSLAILRLPSGEA